MRIPLERNSKTPLYQQIENHLRQDILAGRIPTGTRLPATRQLAESLSLNRLTVEKAYSVLELSGLVSSRIGSGTFVNEIPPKRDVFSSEKPTLPEWQQKFERNIHNSNRLPLSTSGNLDYKLISFANGSGDPALYPVEEFRKTMQNTMRHAGNLLLDYGNRFGYPPLRETIAQILTIQGISTNPDEILITGGSQQAIALVCQCLLKTGDTILVETPTYGAGLSLFKALGLNVTGIEMDADGMQTDQIERLLIETKPGLIYTIPNFHNPTGSCLSLQRRYQLVELANQYNIPILEDDYVGDLRYDGRALPTLKSLDQNHNVLYTSTFSKMLMPGLRVGFLVSGGPFLQRIADYKWNIDLSTSNLIQQSLYEFMTVGRYQKHLQRACRIYKKRRDIMNTALKEFLPENYRWELPVGGFFIWLELPEPVEAINLKSLALQNDVDFVTGDQFYASSGPIKHIRLNFAVVDNKYIPTGIKRLASTLTQYFGQ